MVGRPVLNSTGYQAMMLSIWGVLVFGILVSLRWFALRRHTQPIKGRGIWSVITVQVICLAFITLDAVQYLFPPSGYPCSVNFWYTVVSVALFGSVYVARCWKLYFNIKLGEEISSGQIPHSNRTPTLKGRTLSGATDAQDETAIMGSTRALSPSGEDAVPLTINSLRAYTSNPSGDPRQQEQRDKSRNSLSTQPEEELEHGDSNHNNINNQDNFNSTSVSSSTNSLAEPAPAPAIAVIPPESQEEPGPSHSRQPSLICGNDVRQQNLLNMALSLYSTIPDGSRGTDTPTPPPESATHLRIPSNTLSIPPPASPSSTHSDNDETRLLNNSSPFPLSPASSTALLEASPSVDHADSQPIPAITINPSHGAVPIPTFSLPPHVEEEDPNRLDSTASSNKASPRLKGGFIVSETVPSRRSQVFASYDNGTFSRVSHVTAEPKESEPVADGTTEAVGEPDVTQYAAGGWFMEHRFLHSNVAMVLIVTLLTVAALVPAAILFMKTSADIGSSGGCVSPARVVYIGILVVCYLLIIAPMFFFFIPRTDGFSIIRELAFTISGVLVGVVMAGLSRSKLLNDWSNEVFPLDDVAIMVIAASFWISSMIFPIYRSYVLEENIVNETRSGDSLDYVPLSVLLEDAEGLELFAVHLQSEFSLENLVFWECVEDFRSMTAEISDPTIRYRLALRVFDSCIRARSMFEVNLPSMIRKNIIEDLFPNGRALGYAAAASNRPQPQAALGIPLSPRGGSDRERDREREFSQRNAAFNIEMSRIVQVNAGATSIDAGFFDAAQHSIFQLMNSDSFVRFRHTAPYKDYVKRYKARASQGLLHNIQSLFTETGAPCDDLLAFRRQRSSSARASWSRDANNNTPLMPNSGSGVNQNTYSSHAPGGYNNTSLSRVSASGFRPSLNEIVRPEMSAHRNVTGSISSGRISLLHNVPSTSNLPSRSWEHPSAHPSA